MAKHAAPTLVRYWKDGYQSNSVMAFVDDWELDDNGATFTIADSDLLAVLARDCMSSVAVLTVYSTEELEWSVERVDHNWSDMRVRCVPRVGRLRNSLMSDEYLIWLWLEAEKRHRES
jgi:hypothetical protein